MRILTVAGMLTQVLLAWTVQADMDDYVHSVSNLSTGITLHTWVRTEAPRGRAWAVRVDRNVRQIRVVTRFGDTNKPGAHFATVAKMAETLQKEGRNPLFGLNGDYFGLGSGNPENLANPNGLTISDNVMIDAGSSENPTTTDFYTETADHALSIASMENVSNSQKYSQRTLLSGGKKVRNAARTAFVRLRNGNYECLTDKWHPTEDETYPRSMVGISTNLLVFFISDGRQPNTWSKGIKCKDATDMIKSLGCTEIGEFDGGGSAGMWARDIAGDKGNHYVNHPCDGYDKDTNPIGNPRAVAQGIFILDEEMPWEENARIQTKNQAGIWANNPYGTLDETLTAVGVNEIIQLLNPVPLKASCNVEVSCTMMSTKGVSFKETPVERPAGQMLNVLRDATLALNRVAFDGVGGSIAINVFEGGTLAIQGPVSIPDYLNIQSGGILMLAADPKSDLRLCGCGEGRVFGRSNLAADKLDACITNLIQSENLDLIAVAGEADVNGLRRLSWEVGTVRVNGIRRYVALDDALSVLGDGGRVELLFDTVLDGAWTINTNCTIQTVDGKTPLAIQFGVDASLTIGAGKRVLFSDISFAFGANTDNVTVAPGGVAVLRGACANAAFETFDSNGLEIAGPLTSTVRVDCASARAYGQVFAVAGEGVDLPMAQACADKFVNTMNDELSGEAFEDEEGHIKFRWRVASVPDGEAKLRMRIGEEYVNFRSFHTLLSVMDGDMDIEVLQDCELAEIVKIESRQVKLSSTITPAPSIIYTGEALLVVGPGATLEISGITLRDATAYGAILVDGEDAKLTLGAGAAIRDCCTMDQRRNDATGEIEDNVGYAGGISVWKGEATLKDGCEITGCRGEYEGGAAYVFSDDASLNLEGCVLTNNLASQYGGGVYVGEGATVCVGGNVTVKGNLSEYHRETKTFRQPDDINLFSEYSYLVQTDEMTSGKSSIGVRYNHIEDVDCGFGNANGDAFGYLYTSPDETSAAVFFCDELPRMFGRVSDDESYLVWTDPGDKLAPDDSEVRVLLINLDNNVTNCYATVDPAFRDAAAWAKAEIVLLDNATIGKQAQVSTHVRIRSTQGAAQPYCLVRDTLFEGDAIVVRGVGAALTFTDVVVSNEVFETALVEVDDRGIVTLGADTAILNPPWTNNLRSAVIKVGNGGEFVMESGSLISNSVTDISTGLIDYPAKYPAVFADCTADQPANVEIRGGTIAGFETAKSYALYLGPYVNVQIAGHVTLEKNVVYLVPNATAETLELAGSLTGRVDVVMGENVELVADGKTLPQGVFGWCEGVHEGARVFSNVVDAVGGCLVTNDSIYAWLVWESALQTDPESGLRYYEFEESGERFYEMAEKPEPVPPGPLPPEPEPVTTNYPGAIAFKSIDRMSETEWALVITNRVQWCRYRLIWTDDLTKGFAMTGDWEQVTEDKPEWKTNVIFSAEALKSAYFWRAEGTWGIVPKE